MIMIIIFFTTTDNEYRLTNTIIRCIIFLLGVPLAEMKLNFRPLLLEPDNTGVRKQISTPYAIML